MDMVIECAQFADEIHLEKTLAFCIMWIVLNFGSIRDRFPVLFTLSQELFVRVLQGVAAGM